MLPSLIPDRCNRGIDRVTSEAQYSTPFATFTSSEDRIVAHRNWVGPPNFPPRTISSSSLFTYQEATDPSAPTDSASKPGFKMTSRCSGWFQKFTAQQRTLFQKLRKTGAGQQRIRQRKGHAVDLKVRSEHVSNVKSPARNQMESWGEHGTIVRSPRLDGDGILRFP